MLSGDKKTEDITGVTNDNLCDSLALNFESDRVVVGTTRNDNTGQIKIYDYDQYFSGTATANTWVLAASIYGNTNSKFGKSADMNYDGNRIVVGAPGENKVYVYDATSTSANIWQTYVSNTITGTIGSNFGWSVSIARDISTKIAIGSPSENKVYMYELTNSTWSQTWSNIATDVPNRVPLTATTDIYMDSNNASYGYSVDLAAFGRFLAIGAPGVLTTISSSNSTYTGGTTFGDTYYDIGERLYKIVPKTGGIFQRGYIRCFATSNVNSSWVIYSEVTQHGQILYGSTLSNLSNFPGINTTVSWSLAGLGFSVSISFDGTKVVGGEPFYSLPGTESSVHKGNVRAWVFNNVKITNNWEELTSSAATWFGDKFGYAVKLDYDGGRLAVGSTKRWSGGSAIESEDHGGVHVFDFTETTFYQVSPGNNDFSNETGHVAVAITNGKVVACGVRDFLSNYSGKVRFYNMVLSQVIKGNTVNGGYIAADALYIGPNDNLEDNSFRKRISFGGTFNDNKYDATEIENRSFSTDLAYKGHSELFFVKKSVGAGGDGGRDMIRLKANEIQLHNYITRGGGSDDGKYDMYPRLTMNEEGNFKLNAEFLYGQQGWSYSSCDVKALLDINGDTFCRGKINAGHKNRSNTRGITRELGIIFYDTRNRDIISGTSVKSIEMTELIRENRPGTIVGSVQYNDDASAFKINTLSSYIYNNEGGYAHDHEGLKLSCWIKLTKLHNQYSASGETILSAGNLSGNFSKCQIYNEGIQIRYNSGYLLKKSVTLTKDRWYHLFFYLSNRTNVPSTGNNYILIDGVSQTLIGSGSTSTAPSVANSNFYVGSTTDSIIDAYIGMVHARNTNNGDANRSLTALDLYNNGPPSERLSVGGQAIIEQKLGIGTTLPTRTLDVGGSYNISGGILVRNGEGSGGATTPTTPQMAFGWNGSDTYQHFIRTRHNSAAITNNAIDFYVCNTTENNSLSSGVTHNLTLEAGNVGIGTASPSAKLTINSTGTANPGENGIYVYNPTYQSGDAIITARVNGTGGDPFISFDIANVLGWTFGIDSSDAGKLKWGATWGALTENTKMTLDTSGNLGIGTITPTGKLHIYEATGIERSATRGTLTIQHGNSGGRSSIVFPSAINYGSDHGFIEYLDSYESGDEKSRLIIGVQNDAFNSYQDDLILLPSGAVGIGTTTPTLGKVHIVGSVTPGIGGYAYLNSSAVVHIGSTNNPYSLYCDRYIAAEEFNAHSDIRIKKNIVDINDSSALDKIRLIEPKIYNYIDEHQRGTSNVYGFIAQQVYDVLPYAVTISEGDIPNILTNSNVVSVTEDNTIIELHLDSTVEGLSLSNTSKINIITSNNKNLTVPVLSFTGSNVITIQNRDEFSNVSGVYIHGENIKDFHHLNKDAIWAVASAALQEVDRQLQTEKTKVATLETQIADLLARVTALES